MFGRVEGLELNNMGRGGGLVPNIHFSKRRSLLGSLL